jgi:hypothetical protein
LLVSSVEGQYATYQLKALQEAQFCKEGHIEINGHPFIQIPDWCDFQRTWEKASLSALA